MQSLLARALVALLLIQWANAPAHCLTMSAVAIDAGVICGADMDGATHPGGSGNGGMLLDRCCPACHALGHIALPAEAGALPQRINWSLAIPLTPRLATAPAIPPASPLQPRAPPELPA